jgi:hypothetical protein
MSLVLNILRCLQAQNLDKLEHYLAVLAEMPLTSNQQMQAFLSILELLNVYHLSLANI